MGLFDDVTAKVLATLGGHDAPLRIYPRSGATPFTVDAIFRRDQVLEATQGGTMQVSIGMPNLRFARHVYTIERGDRVERAGELYQVTDITEDGLGQSTATLARLDGPAR